MEAANRKLIAGLLGIAILLISMLVYAQVNVSHNYDLREIRQSAE